MVARYGRESKVTLAEGGCLVNGAPDLEAARAAGGSLRPTA